MQVDLKKNIMSKYSDKIIVGGCSFTDKNYPSRAKPKPLNFKMWPEVIGELYDCEVINTAKCGFGNMAIYHETLDAIIKNKDNIKHVYVMWSEWARQDFLLNDYSYHITQADGSRTKITKRFDTMIPRAENDEYDKTQLWYRKSFNFSGTIKHAYPNLDNLIDTNLNYIYSMQSICENLNIPYTFAQAIKPIPAFHFTNDNHKRDNAIAIKLIEHKTSDLIKEKNFWGWPIAPEIGGFNVLSFLKRAMGETGYKVSFKDTHPNEKAHRLIAKELYDYSIQK